jgi:hypothetical protein
MAVCALAASVPGKGWGASLPVKLRMQKKGLKPKWLQTLAGKARAAMVFA